MWRLLLGTMGVKSLVQGLNAAATAGFEPRTVWSEVRRCNRLATAPPSLQALMHRLTLTDHTRVFAMATVVCTEAPVLALHNISLVSRAFDVVQPDWSGAFSVICTAVRSIGWAKTKLLADDIRITLIPAVVTDCSPLVLRIYLHSTTVWVWSTD